jgi:murein L,D-transpeptidase YcbB/YkuD
MIFDRDRRRVSSAYFRLITSLAAFALLTQGPLKAAPSEPDISTQIIFSLENEPHLALPVRQYRETMVRYYVEGNGRPLWIGTGLMPGFIALLRGAEDHGLQPSDYPVDYLESLLDASAKTDVKGHSLIEQLFSAHFLKFAADLKTGRLLPNKVDPGLYWKEKRVDLVGALQTLDQIRDVPRFVEFWQPQIPEYLALKGALQTYRKLSAAGGWAVVPPGEVLKPGMSDARVPVVRRRLAATDGAVVSSPGSADGETLYDESLIEAVKHFQKRHGLEPDGVIGQNTLLQLNIPVNARIRQIIANMERWRWMPERLGDHYIMVNIAGFELKRVRNDRVEEKMRVVVGLPYHRTPIFSETMKYLEINPYWNVPHSIAIREELPKLQSDPAELATAGFEAVSGDKVIDVRSVDWRQYSTANFPFRLRQKPGPRNALGRVKFMFPNRFNVYLHDTPSRTLFARAKRAFSHGCIRVARPIDLAEQVLAQNSGWARARIEQVLATGERTIVNLDQPLRVHITYATAWDDANGRVHFAADIYQRDEALQRALFGKPTPSS